MQDPGSKRTLGADVATQVSWPAAGACAVQRAVSSILMSTTPFSPGDATPLTRPGIALRAEPMAVDASSPPKPRRTRFDHLAGRRRRRFRLGPRPASPALRVSRQGARGTSIARPGGQTAVRKRRRASITEQGSGPRRSGGRGVPRWPRIAGRGTLFPAYHASREEARAPCCFGIAGRPAGPPRRRSAHRPGETRSWRTGGLSRSLRSSPALA